MSTILLPLPSEYTLRPFVRPSVHSFKLTCRYQMMLVFGVLWQPLGKTVNIWLLPLDQCGRVYSSSFSSCRLCETLGRLVGSSFAFDLELRTFGWFARWSVLPKGSRSVCVYVCVTLWSYCCRLVACTVFMLTSYFLVMEETPAWKWHLFGECLLLVLFFVFLVQSESKRVNEWMNILLLRLRKSLRWYFTWKINVNAYKYKSKNNNGKQATKLRNKIKT